MEDDKRRPKVVFKASAECVAGVGETLKGRSPDFTITAVRFTGFFEHEGIRGLSFEWETKSAGFGELSIYDENGDIVCDNEAMSRCFVKEVLGKWVDEGMRMVHE